MENEYVIVEFTEEKSVEVVHKSWIKSDKSGLFCYWPKSGWHQKAKKKEIPDTENWCIYPIRIFSFTDDFDKALMRAKRAIDTSNVESDTEEQVHEPSKERRETRPPNRYTCSDSEEDNRTEIPRIYRKPSHKSNDAVAVQPPTPPAYSNSQRKSSPVSHSNDDSFTRSNQTPIRYRDCSRNLLRFSQESPSDRGPSPSILQEIYLPSNRYRERSPVRRPAHYNGSPASSETLSQASSRHFDRNGARDFEDKVLMALARIESTQKEHGNILARIQMGMPRSDKYEDIDLDTLVPTPIETEEELEELNKKLIDLEFQKKLVHFLGSLGGKDIKETARLVLRRVGGNRLWSNFNLKGKNSKKTENAKKSLNSEAIYKVIKKSCKKCHNNATDTMIDEAISETLKRAPHLQGGSKFKKAEDNEEETMD